MILWIDAQLSPALAPWITERFGIEAHSVSRLSYRDATDRRIFDAARDAGSVVMTKDQDFVRMVEEEGPPPRVIWVTLGNTSNARMRDTLTRTLEKALALLGAGEAIVEIAGPRDASSTR
jgi:predicted nuclease of predicted toxin-antitoxin system